MAALAKLLPLHPAHQEMLDKSPQWLEALRLSALGVRPDVLRNAIGGTELTLGVLLLFTPTAAYALAPLMGGALATHYLMDDSRFTKEAIPAAVLGVLLGVHAFLHTAIRVARKAELQALQTAKKE
ncbi:unnamed protein product [Chondrus crispus]|uniref:DoxX family protein n=1 Tax=Chondrus crispus TaxID=2769 RepID=R7QR48_CHOCR|nr:unnamed protein product [Chondrus crispus]CDF39860.1 unnamed protein product [Chondrus crispus]|eukprot:XP_005710154.1 unnamed protein product [Chondrus crispus]